MRQYLSVLLLLTIAGSGQAAAITGSAINQPVTAAAQTTQSSRFVIPINVTIEYVATELYKQGHIKDTTKFISLWNKTKNSKKRIIVPGGYNIPSQSSLARIILILRRPPYMKWVVIPPGLRKEEVAELLATTLGWTESEKAKWITTYTALRFDYREGVFFPDTYLIPVAEKPIDVAKRINRKFDEKFAHYLPQFTAKNIPWTKGLTMASLIQREASNVEEMPLIAGILYNRIEHNIPLGIDATVQYIRGNNGDGWWAPLTRLDLELKKSESKFNTYKYLGMPPHPIASPSISAIEAALNPVQTDCLYYLHDKQQNIHCAVTYEEHRMNVQKYLK